MAHMVAPLCPTAPNTPAGIRRHGGDDGNIGVLSARYSPRMVCPPWPQHHVCQLHHWRCCGSNNTCVASCKYEHHLEIQGVEKGSCINTVDFRARALGITAPTIAPGRVSAGVPATGRLRPRRLRRLPVLLLRALATALALSAATVSSPSATGVT